MLNTGEMILSSLSKVWHLVPIVVAIVLFKKFMNNKDKKRRIKINEEKENEGLNLESRTIKKYEDLGYKIEEATKDQGIDFICSKDDKTFLFKCTNTSMRKSIIDEDIKIFCNNAIKYVKTNDIKSKEIEYRYIIAYSDVLHKSAIKILTDDSYNCKYVVL